MLIIKQRDEEIITADFIDYLSGIFSYLEYYVGVSQGSVLLNILGKTVIDPQTDSIGESLSVDEATISRINKFLELIGQGDIYKASELIPSLRASLGIQTPAVRA